MLTANACSVLNALDEGYIMGVIDYIQNTCPDLKGPALKREVHNFLLHMKWDKERINYWLDDWFKSFFKEEK